ARRRAAILPDDGAVDGLAGLAVPDDHGLALVGDADGEAILGAEPGGPEGVGEGGRDALEDLGGLVLHPARLREMLGKFTRCARDDRSLGRKQENRRARRSLIDRQDEARHGYGSDY